MKTKTMKTRKSWALLLAVLGILAGREGFAATYVDVSNINISALVCNPNVCAAPSNPLMEECCKCKAPCLGTSYNPAFSTCIKNAEKCPTGSCLNDAQCNDDNMCTDDKCVFPPVSVSGPPPSATPGTCQNTPNNKCDGCAKYSVGSPERACCEKGLSPADGPKWRCCTENHTNPNGEACCNAGFGPIPADKRKCCEEHVSHDTDPGTPLDPSPCPPPENCPRCRKCVDRYGALLPEPYLQCCIKNDWSSCGGGSKCTDANGAPLAQPYLKCCQTGDWSECAGKPCEPPPPLDCNAFLIPETKACCEKYKSVPALAIAKCVPPGECNNVINIGPGATINGANFVQCCNMVTAGDVTDSFIGNACGNLTIPDPGTPGTPTTPSGSPTVGEGSCVGEPMSEGDIIDGKVVSVTTDGGPVAYRFRLKAPGASNLPAMTTVTSVGLVQVGGTSTWSATSDEATSGFGGAKSIGTKAFSAGSQETVIEPVYAPRLATLKGTPDQQGSFEAQWSDPAGGIVATARCSVKPLVEAKGGGCSLRRNP